VLLRAGKLVLRLAVTYLAIYLLWLPLQAGYVRLMSSCAGRILPLVDDPPVVTGLTPSGNGITLESYLSGRVEPIAFWGADNLHIFVVVSLALVLSLPAGGWRRMARRLSWSLATIFLFTLALTVVQIRTTAEEYASGTLGLTLYTLSQKLFLDRANRALIMVGMLLLPIFLFLAFYVGSWFRTAPGAQDSRVRPGGEKTGLAGTGWRIWSEAALALLPAAIAGLILLLPVPQPGPEAIRDGLERLVALNPSSPQAFSALGLHLEERGKLSEARAAYETTLSLNPQMTAARFELGNIQFRQGSFGDAAESYRDVILQDPQHSAARNNLANALFQEGLYSEAEKAFQEALAADEGHASTHKNLAEMLLHLHRPCEALPHLKRAGELDQTLLFDPSQRNRLTVLEAQCGSGVPGAARAKLPADRSKRGPSPP
jgi:tetratricopeptide (TPR) repeat protein